MSSGGFKVQIKCDRKLYCKYGFTSAEDAARHYDEKARELHGEFAYQNFPQGGTKCLTRMSAKSLPREGMSVQG